MARFKVAIEIYHPGEAMAILAMKQGLHPFEFTFSFDKTFSKSYLELLTCTQKYIHIEEGVLLVSEKPMEDPRRSRLEKDQMGARLRNINPYAEEVGGRRVQLTSIITTLLSWPLEARSLWRLRKKHF